MYGWKRKTYYTAISLVQGETEELVEFSIKLTFNREIKTPSTASNAAKVVVDKLKLKGKLEGFEEDMFAVRFFDADPSNGKLVNGFAVKCGGVMSQISEFTTRVSEEKIKSLKPLSL